MIVTITTYGPAEYLCRLGLLAGELTSEQPVPRVAQIQEAVARRFRIPLIEMTSARRAPEVARPRQIAMYLAKRLTRNSLPAIGRMFGDRDHTTVIHACRRIERLRHEDAEIGAAVAQLERELGR